MVSDQSQCDLLEGVDSIDVREDADLMSLAINAEWVPFFKKLKKKFRKNACMLALTMSQGWASLRMIDVPFLVFSADKHTGESLHLRAHGYVG